MLCQRALPSLSLLFLIQPQLYSIRDSALERGAASLRTAGVPQTLPSQIAGASRDKPSNLRLPYAEMVVKSPALRLLVSAEGSGRRFQTSPASLQRWGSGEETAPERKGNKCSSSSSGAELSVAAPPATLPGRRGFRAHPSAWRRCAMAWGGIRISHPRSPPACVSQTHTQADGSQGEPLTTPHPWVGESRWRWNRPAAGSDTHSGAGVQAEKRLFWL